jgi:ELMO domain-containing protein
LIHCLNEIVSHPIPEALIQDEIVDRAVKTIVLAKKINTKHHPGFSKGIGRCVEAIYGFKRLQTIVDDLRLQSYDPNNNSHETKLLAIWKNLMPDVELENRISKQWQDIGFQGDDPSTDFRGMGMLGLENLLYFTHEYVGTARHLLSHSQHPRYGYTLAVVSINITHLAWKFLMNGQAKSHFYNISRIFGYASMEHFHQFYCYLLFEFDLFWMNSKPDNLMQFNIVQEKFEKAILRKTKSEKCLFKMNLSVENV